MAFEAAPIPASPAPPAPGPRAGAWDRYDRVVGWTLLLLWMGLAAGMLLRGTYASTLADLERRVASGDVQQVEVVGSRPSSSNDGYLTVDLVWRAGFVRHSATVVESSNEREARRARAQAADGTVVVGMIDDHLRRLDPEVRLVPSERQSGSSVTLGRFTGPGLIGIGWLALVIGCLGMTGPRTWRASGWAWAWLILLAPPYGVLAFLVLGGPTGLFPPREPRRMRLTGGWAFLLALALGGVMQGSA